MSILKGLLQDEEFLIGAGLLSAGSQGQSIGQAAFPSILQAAQVQKAFAPKINKTKAAVDTTIDPSTGKSNLVFVSDKQIAEQPNRFIPQEKKANTTNIKNFDPSETPLKIRKQYLGESKDFIERNDSRNAILSNTNIPFKKRTAQDDFTLVYKYYKFVDPGSVVKETEFENLENVGSAGDKIKRIIPKWTKGTTLTQSQVQGLEKAMEREFPSYRKDQVKRENTYKKIFDEGNYNTEAYLQSFLDNNSQAQNLPEENLDVQDPNNPGMNMRGMGKASRESQMTTEELIEEYKRLKGLR